MSVSSPSTTGQQAPLDLPVAVINPYLGLLLATVAVSFSAILNKESSAPSTVIAAYRLAITSLLLAPFMRKQGFAQLRTLSRRQHALLLAAGVLLALHFAFWNASLFETSVASSVLFVSVHPVLVALIGWLVLGERITVRASGGIVMTLLGSLIVAWGDLRISGEALKGDGLALLGAIVFAVYLLIGRSIRPKLDNVSYSTPIYTVAAVALIAITFPLHQSLLQVQGQDLLIFVALAVVCTLGGHLLFNWALRYLTAAAVSVSFLGDPVLSSLLAWPILGQALSASTLIGGLVILAGIWLTVRS